MKNQILDYHFLPSRHLSTIPLRKSRFLITYFCPHWPWSTIPLREISFQIIYFCPPRLSTPSHYEKLDFRSPIFALPTFFHNPITRNQIIDYLFLHSQPFSTITLRKISIQITISCPPGLYSKFHFEKLVLDCLFLPSRSLPTTPLRKIRLSIIYFCAPGHCPQYHCEKLDFRLPFFAHPAFRHNPITKKQTFEYLFLHSRSFPQSHYEELDFRSFIFALPFFFHNPITKKQILDFLILHSRSLSTIPLRKSRFSITYFRTRGICPQSHYKKVGFRLFIFALPGFVHHPITKKQIFDHVFLHSRSFSTIPLRKIRFSITYFCTFSHFPQSHYEKLDFRIANFAHPDFLHNPITKNQIFNFLFLHSRPLSTITLQKSRFLITYFCSPGLCLQSHYEKIDFRLLIFPLPAFVHNPITKIQIFDQLFLPSSPLSTIPLRKITLSITYFCTPCLCLQSH